MKDTACKILYVLHKKGENSHYKGLAALASQNNMQVKFREFSIVGRSLKGIFKLDANLYAKQWVNLFFMLGLLFSKNKRVVLGIAPYDYKLRSVLFFLKKHKVYYHTSWTSWDGSYYPKKKFVNDKLKQKWADFLETTSEHIFAVSGKTKEELTTYYKVPASKVSVVYHTVNPQFFIDYKVQKKEGSFIYVGRLLEEKGLTELLDFFAERPSYVFTIVGNGVLENRVNEYATKYANVNYMGYISDKEVLAKLYQEHQFLLMNSQRTERWEELFGMSIVEAMACKTLPVATSHSGPKEIIKTGENGILVQEGEMVSFLENELLNLDIVKLSTNAYQTAVLYTEEEIAKRWEPILA